MLTSGVRLQSNHSTQLILQLKLRGLPRVLKTRPVPVPVPTRTRKPRRVTPPVVITMDSSTWDKGIAKNYFLKSKLRQEPQFKIGSKIWVSGPELNFRFETESA
jgi:hypothetical protein